MIDLKSKRHNRPTRIRKFEETELLFQNQLLSGALRAKPFPPDTYTFRHFGRVIDNFFETRGKQNVDYTYRNCTAKTYLWTF